MSFFLILTICTGVWGSCSTVHPTLTLLGWFIDLAIKRTLNNRLNFNSHLGQHSTICKKVEKFPHANFYFMIGTNLYLKRAYIE